MGIERVERFHCGRCGYITEYPPIVEQVKKTGICPACQNGKAKTWTSEVRKNHPYRK